jgi:hypothetical protein
MNQFPAIPQWQEFPGYRLSDTANPDRCAKCQSAIWVCLSHWIAAFTLQLDPEPLSQLDELKARLANRRIWQAVNTSIGTFTVNRRDAAMIAKAKGSEVVLAEHVCDPSNIRIEIPAYWPQIRFPDTGKVPF